MKQLSIIVPIYNTEKYLRKCVDSLLEQDFVMDPNVKVKNFIGEKSITAFYRFSI